MKVSQECIAQAMFHYDGRSPHEPGALAPEVSELVGPWVRSRGGALEFDELPESVRTLLQAVPGLLAPPLAR